MKRRDFIKTGAALAASAPLLRPVRALAEAAGEEVNDIHAQLNKTIVHDIARPESPIKLMEEVEKAQKAGRSVSVCGARHAMGGQQFGTRGTLIDTTRMNKVIALDREAKTVEIEAGIMWPQLISWLNTNAPELCVIQKQTGADELTLGGALASNIPRAQPDEKAAHSGYRCFHNIYHQPRTAPLQTGDLQPHAKR